MRLSVLDLTFVRTDQSSRDALSVTVRLADTADRLGYTRFWTAEHHNTSALASTSPAVMIAHLAARTSRIRLGSGGVMLPNHPPLVVAEQFALLESLAPGRIDLGVGRAPGGRDLLATAALRGGRRDDGAADTLGQHIDDVATIMTADGMEHEAGDERGRLRATPAATNTPPIWVLGSSPSSALLAADKGLPYVYAHHFGRGGTHEALSRYRQHFTARTPLARPTAVLTAMVSVAPNRADARAAMVPVLLLFARQAAGQPLGRVELVDDHDVRLPLTNSAALEQFNAHAVVGTPKEAAEQLRDLAARFQIDEVMVCPVASERRGTDPATAPTNESTLELLARELL
ncbi:alkanal monooxygenase subunit alpha (plasmid) [Mycolicibacterium arabiense]|uniref:Alkanal monooxygenase subunit alpha n=1 Tax=Mycolicibacterium arabiense TaxID=1286181 RepID=A0A7I7RQ74_9MYCO|nr:MsnO8 family LLM class oxidoreductase [Mycolicibacterium arabiense]MCV7376913.1 MsnO8 family LLM class oxidoreductase [Mycolicibacterium arabiense]BBY46724.1 alkanal monooxygenase subunit alpha [Mycolicibacterium arabiense]